MTDERIDRVDRVVLRMLGTLAVLLGLAVLLHSVGAFGAARRQSPVVSSPTAAWYRAHEQWVWPSVGLVLVSVAGLCIWWVAAQVRLQGAPRIELEHGPTGALHVSGHHLADCVERDAASQVGVDHARARVSTTPDAVHVWLTIWVGPPYDVGRAVARVANTVLPNLAVTLDGERSMPIRTHITVETAEAAVPRLG